MRQAFVGGGAGTANVAVAKALKAEFPLFDRQPELAYLDNAATTQKPGAVLDAEADFYRFSCANVHRAIHALGEEATGRYEAARTRIAGFIGAAPQELVFTSGTTASINLVARTLGEEFAAGDEIVLSEMEHHANIVPWQMLAARRGVVLRYIPLADTGELDLAAYERLLGPRTRLVALTMASNVLGTINPVKPIIESAHAAGALVLLDAAQAVPRSRLDVAALDADFVAFSAHKLYGPFGIGALYGKEALLERMPPFMGGGDMIREVSLEGFSVNELPYKFEAGTPAIAQAIGFAAAVEWLDSVDPEALGAYESALARNFIAAISGIPGIRVLGAAGNRAGLVAFTLEGVHAHDLAAWLDRGGVAVRAGHHCAHPLARRLGIQSSARASFGAYNLPEDAQRAASLLARASEEA
ncbi:MAG: aminotransferase class V-fold PLP-dependent enzyme [Clostridia bacterium]|jgi:cysteine desulfurase/selenocysteine lyase